jgi:5'-nucleotidase (lipoprotein e(P4) family)
VLSDAAFLPPGTAWTVVLDLDETSLDNSAFQQKMLERKIDFDPSAWAVWEESGQAKAIPPAIGFVAAIRGAGGHVAWISNRLNVDATKRTLVREGLWSDDDRLCLRGDANDKAPRRDALRKGEASCGWVGTPMRVLAYLGDQRSDFPADGEEPATDASPWGRTWFMLPNPMYGSWIPKSAPPPAGPPPKGKPKRK